MKVEGVTEYRAEVQHRTGMKYLLQEGSGLGSAGYDGDEKCRTGPIDCDL